MTITAISFPAGRALDRIAQEAALDGVYFIRTSVPETELNAEDTI